MSMNNILTGCQVQLDHGENFRDQNVSGTLSDLVAAKRIASAPPLILKMADPAGITSPSQTARNYAGITVLPMPEVPTTCCQSGCTYCVWDIYRDELEEREAAREKAINALKARNMEIPSELREVVSSDIDPSIAAFMKLERDMAQSTKTL